MVIIDNCDASFAVSHIIRQIVSRPEVEIHLSGEDEPMMDTQPGPGTNLPFGRRPISFFDDNASSAFTSQARGLVKELIAKSQGEEGDDHHLPDDLRANAKTRSCLFLLARVTQNIKHTSTDPR